jgi:hypothetical protein
MTSTCPPSVKQKNLEVQSMPSVLAQPNMVRTVVTTLIEHHTKPGADQAGSYHRSIELDSTHMELICTFWLFVLSRIR